MTRRPENGDTVCCCLIPRLYPQPVVGFLSVVVVSGNGREHLRHLFTLPPKSGPHRWVLSAEQVQRTEACRDRAGVP